MKIRILILFIILFTSNNALSFEGLSSIKIPVRDEIICINYNSRYSTVINKDITDKESGIRTIRLLETNFKPESDERYIIDFCEGASWDPMFEIYRLEDNKLTRIGIVGGLEITIPSNGYFYVSGHTDNMFNKRRKFTTDDGKIKEIRQPFYYVGLDSKAMKDIDIYSDINMSTVIEHIKKDTSVKVLVNYNKDYYLIKTKFGLTGWIKIPFGSKGESELKGIYFAGD